MGQAVRPLCACVYLTYCAVYGRMIPWYCVSRANTIVESEILCNMDKEWGVMLVQL